MSFVDYLSNLWSSFRVFYIIVYFQSRFLWSLSSKIFHFRIFFLQSVMNFSISVSSSKPYNISSVIVWSAHSRKQEITSSTFLREGDTVTFTCTGNIGNPPGKFIWQMYSPQHNQLIVYTNATTEKEEKPENCTFRGTSNMTVHLTPDHFEAKYCCFEESQKDVAGMYVETEPLNIHCKYSIVCYFWTEFVCLLIHW